MQIPRSSGSQAKSHTLRHEGWVLAESGIEPRGLENLARGGFAPDVAGTRCLLDLPEVRRAAERLREKLVADGLLPPGAVAIQAIAFDKNPAANWKVTWHQDLMFPFARPVQAPGYDLRSRKAGVDYARPPRGVLEALLAVRLHLDECDENNGPLRVAPGSHRGGILKGAEIANRLLACGEVTVLARAGEALLMKPLLLHASSPAREPRHRRVLHVVYHDGGPVAEPWHRQV